MLHIRKLANEKLGVFLQPINGFLEKLAKRIEKEGDEAFKASTNVKNVHNFTKIGQDAELQSVLKNKPNWVDIMAIEQYKALGKAPIIPHGYPNIGAEDGSLKKAFETFHAAKAVIIPEGEVLYRVVDPRSADNSICWMRESEFKKLRCKADWRRRFAVFSHWNSNGEYVTYVVPKGGIKAWEGPAASQIYNDSAGSIKKINNGKDMLVLEGGAPQIVLDPKDLIYANVSKRYATGWGYDSGLIGDSKTSMVGVPTLQNNWRK